MSAIGNNRYLSRPTYSYPEWLGQLDETVWCVRRYAQNFVWAVELADGTMKDLTDRLVATASMPGNRAHPESYRPFQGYLEQVRDRSSTDPARQALTWRNRYFSTKGVRVRSSATWSSSAIRPQHRDWFVRGQWKSQVEPYVKLKWDQTFTQSPQVGPARDNYAFDR